MFAQQLIRRTGRFTLALLFLAASLIAPSAVAAQAQTQSAEQKSIKLNRIEFTGLKRISREEAIEQSGLQEGEAYTPEHIDETADRLSRSGLFRALSYGVSGRMDGATLTFKVEEAETSAMLPVVFDNFVWFTDEELTEAVRRRMPSFNGRAPDGGDTTQRIAAVLEEMLAARKIAGKVEHMLSTDAAGRNPEHVFTVTGTQMRVCRLSFPGARTFTEDFLRQKAGSIFANEYSRKYVSGYAEGTLLPLYHERGILRAGFLPPRARPYKGDDCENGLSVTIPVEEGPIYVWDRAEWTGNEVLTAKELDAALAMKSREVADGLKFDRGLAAVRRAYGRRGYLTARLSAVPVFDDEQRRVAYRIEIREGPQYRMGELFIEGLSEQDANNLRGRWRLLHGEPFDEGYPDEFQKQAFSEFLKHLASEGRKLSTTKFEAVIKPNRTTHTVGVTLIFK